MTIQVNHAPLVSLYMYGTHSQQMRCNLMGLVAGRATFVACEYNSWPAVSCVLAVTPDTLMVLKSIMTNKDNASFPLHEQLVNRIKRTKTRWQVCLCFPDAFKKMALCENKFHCLQLGRWRAPTRTSKRCGCAESMRRVSEGEFVGVGRGTCECSSGIQPQKYVQCPSLF